MFFEAGNVESTRFFTDRQGYLKDLDVKGFPFVILFLLPLVLHLRISK